MPTGDVSGNLRKLQRELRSLRYDKPFNEAEASRGFSEPFLYVVHHALLNYSRLVAAFLLSRRYEFHGKSDLRFVELLYKLLRDEFGYVPKISRDQFFSDGYAEQKIILATDICSFVLQKHKELLRAGPAPAAGKRIGGAGPTSSTNFAALHSRIEYGPPSAGQPRPDPSAWRPSSCAAAPDYFPDGSFTDDDSELPALPPPAAHGGGGGGGAGQYLHRAQPLLQAPPPPPPPMAAAISPPASPPPPPRSPPRPLAATGPAFQAPSTDSWVEATLYGPADAADNNADADDDTSGPAWRKAPLLVQKPPVFGHAAPAPGATAESIALNMSRLTTCVEKLATRVNSLAPSIPSRPVPPQPAVPVAEPPWAMALCGEFRAAMADMHAALALVANRVAALETRLEASGPPPAPLTLDQQLDRLETSIMLEDDELAVFHPPRTSSPRTVGAVRRRPHHAW